MSDAVPVSNSLIDWSGTTGLVAIVILSLNILMGLLLSSRYNFVRNWPHRRIPLYKMHNWTGYVALGIVLLHPVLLLFQSTVTFRVIDVLWPINSPQQPLINTAGAVAAYALVFIVVTSYFRARIGLRMWKIMHYTSYFAAPVFFVHGILTNPNLDNKPADLIDGGKFLVYACLLIVASAITWRVISGARRAKRPALRPTS